MSIKSLGTAPNTPKMEYTANASTTYTLGKLALGNTSTGEIDEGASTVLTIEGVIAETKTTAASNPKIELYPITGSSIQYWEVDCTNNTAANQLNKVHAMTSATHVANTSTTDATTAGVFYAIALTGVASDNKLIGYFIKIGQVTA